MICSGVKGAGADFGINGCVRTDRGAFAKDTGINVETRNTSHTAGYFNVLKLLRKNTMKRNRKYPLTANGNDRRIACIGAFGLSLFLYNLLLIVINNIQNNISFRLSHIHR